MKIISKLNNQECISIFVYQKDPSLKIMALNSDCFNEFTEKDLTCFKIRDVTKNDVSEIRKPEFIKREPPADIRKAVLFNTFSVLAKSAAALLIKRIFKEAPKKWKILAVPYHGATKDLDFSNILGEVMPFDKDVKIYIKYLNAGVYLVLYIAYGVMLYLFFQISEGKNIFKQIALRYSDAECYSFEGNCIINLVDK